MRSATEFSPYDRWALTLERPRPDAFYSVPIYASVHYSNLSSFVQYLMSHQQWYVVEEHEKVLLNWHRENLHFYELAITDPDNARAVGPQINCIFHRILIGETLFDSKTNRPKEIEAGDKSYKIVELGCPIPIQHQTVDHERFRDTNILEKPPTAVDSGGTPPLEVLFGIIDDGIAPLNCRFTREVEGKLETRFDSLWVQGAPLQQGNSTIVGGEVFERDELQKHLDQTVNTGTPKSEFSVYSEFNKQLRLFANKAEWGMPRAASHGTHIADMAVGAYPWSIPGGLERHHKNIDASSARWIAQCVDIVGVTLAPEAVSDTSGAKLDIQILRALRWIIYRALRLGNTKNLPLIINLSLGFSAGAKDGNDPLAKALRSELQTYQKITGSMAKLVLAFGNNHNKKSTAILYSKQELESAQVTGSSYVDWRILPNDFTPSYLEIRTPDTAEKFEFSITSPGGRTTPFNNFEKDKLIYDDAHSAIGIIYLSSMFEEGSRPTITIAFCPSAVPLNHQLNSEFDVVSIGSWKVEVKTGTGRVTLQVQRDDTPIGYSLRGRQSFLEHPNIDTVDVETKNYGSVRRPLTNLGTHSAIVSDDLSIVSCGATYSMDFESGSTQPIAARYSSRGGDSSDAYAITNMVGPACSAPADLSPNYHGLSGAGNRTGSLARYSGTSVATALVARALILQQRPTIESSTAAVGIGPEDQDRLGGVWYSPPDDRIRGSLSNSLLPADDTN